MPNSRQAVSPRLVVAAAILLSGAATSVPVMTTPAFDLDESFYLRVAEEQRLGSWANPTWDGTPVFDKTPFYTKLLSTLNDIASKDRPIESTTGRWLSWLATWAMGLVLAWLWPRWIARLDVGASRSWIRSRASPLLLLSCAWMPMIGATAILQEPLTSLLLLPAVWGLSQPTFNLAVVAISIATATLFKGLTGWALPAVAIAIHLFRDRQYPARRALTALGLAALLSTLGYVALGRALPPGFAGEFFGHHHWERVTRPLSGHTGGIFKPALVFVLFGGLLAWSAWPLSRPLSRRSGRALFTTSWVTAHFVLFGMSATFLPHYLWTLWPALVLSLGAALTSESRTNSPGASLVPVTLCGVALVLALAPARALSLLASSPKARAWVDALPAFDTAWTLAVLTCALALGALAAIIGLGDLRARASWTLGSLACSTLALAIWLEIAPRFAEALVGPYARIGRIASQLDFHSGCLVHSEAERASSPTLSLAFTGGIVNNCIPPTARAQAWRVAPVWRKDICSSEEGRRVFWQEHYLRLCGPDGSGGAAPVQLSFPQLRASLETWPRKQK